MDEGILRYAEKCLAFKKKSGLYPGSVSHADWPGVLKDCETYVRLSEKEYAPCDWGQQSIDNYKMECIENRLRKYAASARNWGRNK